MRVVGVLIYAKEGTQQTVNTSFHKMVLKTTFKKAKSREIVYHSYKYFDKEKFSDELRIKLNSRSSNCTNYQTLEGHFLEVLMKPPPPPLHDKSLKKSYCK